MDNSEYYLKIMGFLRNFSGILWEATPFIILGAIIAGILEEFLPQHLIGRILRRYRLSEVIAGLVALLVGLLPILLGIAALLLLLAGHPGKQLFLRIWRGILWVLVTVCTFVDRGIAGFLLANPVVLTPIPMGGLLGIVFPMCECGIVPVMRRLLRKGLPLSCCVAYLLAGPIINVVVISSTFVAFTGQESHVYRDMTSVPMGSWWMTGLRIGLGYLIAVVTSLIVDVQYRKYGNALLTPLARPPAKPVDDEEPISRKWNPWKSLSNISDTVLHDFIDITGFLVLGALLATFIRLWLTQEAIAGLSQHHIVLSILLMMGLAILLCLCSELDAFFAASFATLASSAKLAFLVLGPMMDLKLYMLYTRVFRPRLIWTIFGSVLVQVFILSLVVHYVWGYYFPLGATP